MTTQLLNGAEMVVNALSALKVKYIFGYPGGTVLDIYDAIFQQDEFEHILVRHEQAAAHMADGYARSTGKTGTVLVTSGPGATNTITGIATAYMDSIPMVVLSGQVPSMHIGEDAFQETDMVGCSRPIVKHSFLVKRAVDIPKAIAKAYYIANTGRPGPVVVDLPKDIVNIQEEHPYEYPTDINMRSYNPTLKGHNKQIKKAVNTLLKAKRPVLYIGGGAIASEASAQITELAEKLHSPVTSTLMGLGAFSGVHPQFVGMLGMHGTLEANKTMHNADCILALGARFDDRVTNNVDKFCPHATIIHVDIDPASISKTVAVHIPVVGSVEKVTEQILAEVNNADLSEQKDTLADWWQQIDQWRSKKCLNYQKDPERIKPQEVIESIYKHTNGDAYVSSDVGQHQMIACRYADFNVTKSNITSGGLGTMGFALPAAIGAKMAAPERDVVAIAGDGGYQMTIQELGTITIFVSNKILAYLKASVGKEVLSSPSPLINGLNAKVLRVEEGHLEFSYVVTEEMTNPLKILHGGTTAAIIDEIVGATVFTLDKSHVYTTVNLAVDYFSKAGIGETIIAIGTIIKAGDKIKTENKK